LIQAYLGVTLLYVLDMVARFFFLERVEVSMSFGLEGMPGERERAKVGRGVGDLLEGR
jgi:hypothetical protein